MSKKIGSTDSLSPIKASSITKTEEVKGVSKVGKIEKTGNVSSAKRVTRSITLEEREQIIKMMEEEAEKMFAADVAPRKKKKTVEIAVKMVLEAADLQVEED